MSSISKAAAGGWRVRWREGGQQRSRSFDNRRQAVEFQQDLEAGLANTLVIRTVFRAYVNTIPLGLYTTLDAARAHCIADAAINGDDVTEPVWVAEDAEDPDGEQQLFLTVDDGTPHGNRAQTEYSVLPLDLMSDYASDAPRRQM